ncbi:MAG: hypothetical protein PHT88_00765 [Candidatus Moranbacteria bacterium]|nr:hypothetical protein [Candidatus Moranbacteria bacterium]
MHFIQEQVLFFIAIFLVLFVPGLVLLRSFFKHSFTSLECFVFSVPLSIAATNFLMITLGRSGITLMVASIIASIIAFTLVTFLVSKAIPQKTTQEKRSGIKPFTKNQGRLIILILILTIFIKTIYLSQVILPTATDLGHHMYWSKSIAVTGELPQYVERNIVRSETDGTYALGEAEPIDDFIIGEHLIFAAIALIAGLDFISGFPAIILLLINIFSLLALFLFVLRAFSHRSLAKTGISANTVAILTLFVLGPLYTIASPQAKFVSGGVIGNTIGNLFIPVILYCYWRALQEKSSKLLTLAFFLTFGLVYIHHLSTLVFLFIIFFTIVIFSILHIKTIHISIKEWALLVFKPAPIILAIAAILFSFFVLAPSYADPKSLNTALGAPTKATRTGLTFLQLTFSTGEGRLGLGLVGLLALIFFRLKENRSIKEASYAIAFFFAWGLSLLIMSLRPQWLFLDIPSNRISTYAIFPFAILSTLAFTLLFKQQKTINSQQSTRNASDNDAGGSTINEKHSRNNTPLTISAFIVILTFFIVGGFYDNGQSLLGKTKAQEAIETYHVSDYLAQHTNQNDIILKDHNYIVADSWMKLSFLRGYTYPLSRGYFKRYEDETKPREQCSLWMIAVPNTDKGQKCFNETGTDIIVVNPHFDSTQFKKSPDFNSIYQSGDIAVYMRKNQSTNSD